MWVLSRLILCAALIEIALAYSIIVVLWWPWPLLLVAIAIWKAVRRGKLLWSHGTAQWATHGELLNANLMGVEKGLPIGRLVETESLAWLPCLYAVFDGRINSRNACIWAMARIRKKKNTQLGEKVRLTKTPHVLIVAPTGLGKTSALVVGPLRESDEPVVCLDYKGEIAALTADHRRTKFGHVIVFLDPYEVVTTTPDCYNPLDFIQKDSLHLIDQCRYLAEQLVIREPDEREKHWPDSAEMWITAAILGTVLFAPSHRRSLQHVREILSDTRKLPALIESLEAYGGIVARLGSQLRHFQDRELASVLTTTNRHLRWLDSPAMQASTSHSTFDPRNLRRGGKITVYCTVPPKFVYTAAPILRLWIGSLMMAVMDEGLNETPVTFVLDEAASLKEMRCIDEAIQKGRGYGVHLQLFYQSTAQLKISFPLGQHENVLANVSQVYFGVNNSLAEELSARLGDQTIIINSGGTSSSYSHSYSMAGQGGSSQSDSVNRNWAPHGRRLLTSAEIATMSERVAITFVPGIRPICTVLERYYEKSAKAKRQSLKKQVFGEAICFLIVTSFCLFFACKLEGMVRHVRIHQPTNRKILPRDFRRRKATSGTRSVRDSSSDLQREWLRHVWSDAAQQRQRPAEKSSRKLAGPTGARSEWT